MAFDTTKPAQGNPVLSDIAQILANFNALRNCEAGAAEPSDLVPGMFWLDTSGGAGNWILKICKEDGATWFDLLDFTAAGMPKAHMADAFSITNSVHELNMGQIGGSLYINNSGSDVFFANDAAVSTALGGYSKLKEIEITAVPGTPISMYFLLSGASGWTNYGKIYVNGVAKGAERSNATASAVGYSELIAVANGDLIQLYGYTTRGIQTAVVSNFRILCTSGIRSNDP